MLVEFSCVFQSMATPFSQVKEQHAGELSVNENVTVHVTLVPNSRDGGSESFWSAGTIEVSPQQLTAMTAPERRGLNIVGRRKVSGLAVGDAGSAEAE